MKLLPRAPLVAMAAIGLLSVGLAVFGATDVPRTDKRLHLNMHCYNPMTAAEWTKFKGALSDGKAEAWSVDYAPSADIKPDHQGKGQVSGKCDCGGKKPNA